MIGIKTYISPARSLTDKEQSDLRDEFAKAAMQAMVTKSDGQSKTGGAKGVPLIAQYAYEFADAMLAAREGTPCA